MQAKVRPRKGNCDITREHFTTIQQQKHKFRKIHFKISKKQCRKTFQLDYNKLIKLIVGHTGSILGHH